MSDKTLADALTKAVRKTVANTKPVILHGTKVAEVQITNTIAIPNLSI